MMKKLLLLLLLLPLSALAQVAHDGESNLQGHSTAATTHNIGNKTTAGSNRVGVVDLRFANAAHAGEPASVTWNGVGMTQIGTGATISSAGGVRSFIIVNPPTASSAVVVTTNTSTPVGYCVRSFSGVHQTTPVDAGATQTATGTSTTPSVTVSSAADNMVLNAATVAGTFSANGAGQTQDCESSDGATYTMRTSREAGAASVVMDHTAGSANWSTHGFELVAAAGASSTDLPAMHLQRLMHSN